MDIADAPKPTTDIVGRFPADHAMQGEYAAAAASRSVPQLQLFILRHPHSEQAKQAKKLITQIQASER